MRYLNNMRYILPLALVVLMLTACEKVINVDLNDAEKKYVIEAVMTDQPNSAEVRITQTKNFDEDNDFVGIGGATVTITESGGATTTLVEGSSGIYVNSSLAGVPGKTYLLAVQVNGQTFSATCTMPQKVAFDSLFVTNEFLFTDTRRIANVDYRDPAGRGNNYRFVQYVNNHKEEEIFIQNDDYTDGRNVSSKLYFFPEDDDSTRIIEPGDQLEVEMQNIDPVIYKYWYSLLRSSVGNEGQATPSNPVSNIRGGALGYFSAHTKERKMIVVP